MTTFKPGARIPNQIAREVRAFLRSRGVKAKVAITNRERTLEIVIDNRLWWFGRDPYYVRPFKHEREGGPLYNGGKPLLSELTENDLEEIAHFPSSIKAAVRALGVSRRTALDLTSL